MKGIVITAICMMMLTSCNSSGNAGKNKKQDDMATDSLKQYGYNLSFLKRYVDVIELKNGNSGIAIVPSWQGRVMTSTSDGDEGFSFGWINHDLVSSGKPVPHINPYGGEERIWLGPEGGQFSIYFKKGKEFVYDNWQVPGFLDTLPFEIAARTDSSVKFTHETEVVNYSGTAFKLEIGREVKILSTAQILKETGINTAGSNCVAYKSENTLTNLGNNEWKKETGLLSIWMLGMFTPSPGVTVIIPFRQGSEKELGVVVNDDYFGKIAVDRLKVAGGNIYFRADGKSRGKIGIPPLRATGTMGSYDFDNNILTLLICRLPEGKTEYVNSAWQIQDNPYSGDALNSYNDGPLEDGSQMGPFYELETSSPAAALKPGESLSHIQFTMHLTGDTLNLDNIVRSVFGVSLEEIRTIF
jgi:hypothetical protein